MCDGDYCLTYPDSINLSLADGKLTVQVGSGSGSDISSISDVDTTITGASGIQYNLKGLTLLNAEAGSNDLPIFPSPATCPSMAANPINPGASIPAYAIITVIFAIIAGMVLLLIYNGSNKHLLRAKSWITGKTYQ